MAISNGDLPGRPGHPNGRETVSNTATRLPLAEAQVLADELLELLRPACERIEISGSIRRQRPDVADVELVVIPRIDKVEMERDMFGGVVWVPVDYLERACDELLSSGVLEYRLDVNGRKSWGSDLKKGLYRGFGVDICSATPETWGVTLAIRTGPAKFSERLVTPRSQQGFCPSHLRFQGWRVRRRDTGEPLETPEEADVFAALKIEYLEPHERSDTRWPEFLR